MESDGVPRPKDLPSGNQAVSSSFAEQVLLIEASKNLSRKQCYGLQPTVRGLLLMSIGVSERKECQVVGIIRRGLHSTFYNEGDSRMKEAILTFWRSNTGSGMLLPYRSKSFHE
jgi:hypothetical protein